MFGGSTVTDPLCSVFDHAEAAGTEQCSAFVLISQEGFEEALVLQFLQQVIEDCEGAAPVSVLMATHKSYVSMTLYAVDDVGMIVSDVASPGRKKAYPWSAVAIVRPEIE